jgi:hypothetical protein
MFNQGKHMHHIIDPSATAWRTTRRLLAACSLLAAIAPAGATMLTFDQQVPDVLEDGANLLESGYRLDVLNGPVAAELDLHGIAGAILNPADPYSCALVSCPSGDGSKFYAGLNDGGVRLSRADGQAFKLDHLDFAFLTPLPVDDGIYGKLVLTGMGAGGSSVTLALDLPGQDGYGNFVFASASLGSFAAAQFSSIAISACVFDEDGGCVNSWDQPAFGLANFAIDNVGVSAVPEPSAWMLLLGGLGTVAALRRRAGKAGMAKQVNQGEPA